MSHLDDLDRAAHALATGTPLTARTLDWLPGQLAADAAAGTFAQWGRSTLLDELTGGPILGAPVLHVLQRWGGLPEEFPATNAGLAHVYGYLLSVVETPYGLKRDRWLDGTLALRLGLPAEHFHPWHRPDSRTLAQRVTEAALPLLARPPRDALLVRDDEADLRTVVTAEGVLIYGWPERLVTVFGVDTRPERMAELREQAGVARYNVVLDRE